MAKLSELVNIFCSSFAITNTLIDAQGVSEEDSGDMLSQTNTRLTRGVSQVIYTHTQLPLQKTHQPVSGAVEFFKKVSPL